MKLKLLSIVAFCTIIGASIGLLSSWSLKKHVRHDILIKAKQYSYEPSEIAVNYMDTLHLKMVSMDVVHGFYLEDYDIDAEISPNIKNIKVRRPSEGYNWKDTSEIVVIADKKGKFRYRCSHTCGNMHPFMQGVLIVKPNITLHLGIGTILGFLIGMLAIFYIRIYKTNTSNKDNNTL